MKEITTQRLLFAIFVWAILLLAAWGLPRAEAAMEPVEDIMVVTWDQ